MTWLREGQIDKAVEGLDLEISSMLNVSAFNCDITKIKGRKLEAWQAAKAYHKKYPRKDYGSCGNTRRIRPLLEQVP